MAALVLNFFPAQTAQAGNFTSPVPVAGGNQLYYDMNVRVRPTDGLAFISGAKSKIMLSASSHPADMYDINDSGTTPGSQWPSMTFSKNGTGFVAWRWNPAGFFGYMRIIPAGWNGGALPPGFDLSARISRAAGVGFDQPGLAYSNKDNKLYVAGYFKTANGGTLGVVETSDNGVTFSNYKPLFKDPSNSNMAPEMCVDNNGDIHLLSRLGSQLIAVSQKNGIWESNYTTLISSSSGYDPRDADGRSNKSIVCAPDGTVYAVWKNHAFNGGKGSFGISRRLPGQGWEKAPVSNNVVPFANTKTVNASVSPDGTLWIIMGDDDDSIGRTGTWLLTSTNQGIGLSAPVAIMPQTTYSNASVSIDASGVGAKIHVATSFNQNIRESTYYTYATYDGPGSLPPSVPIPPSQPGDPGNGNPPPPPPPPPGDGGGGDGSGDTNTWLPPSSLSATPATSSKINLSWKDKSSGELDFRIERRTASGSWAEVGTSAANSTSYTDGSMSLNTTYYYRIRARGDSGYTAYSSEASATTLAPTALKFGTQPGNGEAGKPLGQQPVVNVLDKNGNPVKNYNGQISLSLANNPSGATLSNNVASVDNGVATFTSLQLDKGGSGFTLTANPANGSPAVPNVTSNAFDVTGGAPPAPPVDLGQDQRDAPIGLPQFLQIWDHSDKPIVDGQTSRSWTWGPSITGLVNEPYTEGGTRQVQYFDKTRMEQTPGRAVTNGLLAKELITGLMQLGDNTFKQYPANDKIKIAGDQDAPQNPTYASFRKVSTIDQENRVEDRGNQVVNATLKPDGTTGTDELLGTKYNVKNVYYDKTLQHNIPDVFWNFMNQTGPVYDNGTYTQ
jgi:hypothetical protein